MAGMLYLEGPSSSRSSVSTNGQFSFTDLEPGTYNFRLEVDIGNPVFGPCSSMTFNNGAEGYTYSARIIMGEFQTVIATSPSFEVVSGELELYVPFSFVCNP